MNTFKKSSNIFTLNNYIVTNPNERLIRFPVSLDTLIYDGTLYNMNHNFEDIFNIEKSVITHAKKCIDGLTGIGIVNEDALKAIKDKCEKEKGLKKGFMNYSEDKARLLLRKDKIEYLKKNLNIDFDEEKKYILDEDKKIKNFINFICEKITEDPLTNQLREVSSSKLLVIND